MEDSDLSHKLTGNLDCPTCGKSLDGATCVSHLGAAPRTGDMSICIYCGEALQFTGAPLALRKLTNEEKKKLPPSIRAIRYQIQHANKLN